MSARIAGSRARCRQASAYEGGTAPTIARMSRSVASRRDLPYDVARDDPACIAYRTGGGVFRRPRSARRSRLTWFALSLAAALTQAAQFAVVKGRARAIPPLVIVAGTQTVALTVWLGFFLVSGHPFTPPRSAWPAIAASSILVTGMSSLLARASACGDISIVGPVFALSPIFTVIPAVTVRRGLVELATARNVATIVAHGVLGVTGTAMQTNALTMAPAAYVNAIRRLSAVVAVGLGRTLFGEPDLGRRLADAVLASAGRACRMLAR